MYCNKMSFEQAKQKAQQKGETITKLISSPVSKGETRPKLIRSQIVSPGKSYADNVKSKVINNDTAIINENEANVSQVDNPEINIDVITVNETENTQIEDQTTSIPNKDRKNISDIRKNIIKPPSKYVIDNWETLIIGIRNIATQQGDASVTIMQLFKLSQKSIQYGHTDRPVKEVKRITDKAKKTEYWQNFCIDKLNYKTNVKTVWNTVKGLKGAKTSTLPTLISDSKQAVSNVDKANMLAGTFAEASSDNNLDPTFRTHTLKTEIENPINRDDDEQHNRVYDKTKSEQNHELYKTAVKEVKRITDKAKTEYWQNFCDKLNYKTNVKTVWNTVKGLKGAKTSTLPTLISDSKQAVSNVDKANMLAGTFAEASSDNNLDPTFRTHTLKTEIENPINRDDDEQHNRLASFVAEWQMCGTGWNYERNTGKFKEFRLSLLIEKIFQNVKVKVDIVDSQHPCEHFRSNSLLL
ncbi:unnamed protein product [Mytilus coruscus]|uniref:Uncharacterized protein n=1 Tax=Mytilus coruscus TaxID=42192 RepID=A0A6J8ARG6_MYTCO|nr:unnamed protein product [Mytilus coruscus]